jgi:hypothetical protein
VALAEADLRHDALGERHHLAALRRCSVTLPSPQTALMRRGPITLP